MSREDIDYDERDRLIEDDEDIYCEPEIEPEKEEIPDDE